MNERLMDTIIIYEPLRNLETGKRVISLNHPNPVTEGFLGVVFKQQSCT